MTRHAAASSRHTAAVVVGGVRRLGTRSFSVEDPTTAAVIGIAADGTAADAIDAVDAAHAAARGWQELAPRDRAQILRAAHELLVDHVDDVADLICLENGKSAADGHAEAIYAAEFFRWFAEEAARSSGEYGPAPGGGARTIVTHRPVGVAALVTPWNFPAAMPARKIAPALAAGCTVVLKPAAETPLTTGMMAELLQEAGVPGGVVNVVPTTDAASVVGAWLDDARVRKLSFTGSTAVGRTLLRQAAGRIVNCSMELGGAAPFVVFPDADLNAAVAGAMIAKFRNGGQACTAANTFHVHSSVASEFVARLSSAVAALRVGASADGAEIGPMISARAVTTLDKRVRSAVDEGARIVSSAPVPDTGGGHYFPPTVLTDVDPASDLATEEIFGPVAPIAVWDQLDELMARLDRSEYGLAAYIYTSDVSFGLATAERLDVGMVALNRGLLSDPAAPFGGTRQSGLGREGARVGLEEFTETRYISLDWKA